MKATQKKTCNGCKAYSSESTCRLGIRTKAGGKDKYGRYIHIPLSPCHKPMTHLAMHKPYKEKMK
jgi:hypothetical protein